ncbi:adenosylcobinamide-phosphate synthase CbiB [Cohnella panacarvi]|uniref:adenosylcobinamide-phosphate synthase CbiB n=1 Tax=Cohnella panacarvi TaxID=400776 RepID=UPI00047D2B90|nr:adenosylcobinamide-phosphate synthase CbiB [Cohnella panacarvi]
MIFYSLQEMMIMLLAAIVIDWIVGDPKRLPHPVIAIGRLTAYLERRLLPREAKRFNGALMTLAVIATSFFAMWGATALAAWIHPWFGYAAQTWFISTTIAIRGLKDAAMLVYDRLMLEDLPGARQYTGYIVGRDTRELDESEVSRATVETVSENIVDAVISPLFFAWLGAAPLAMLYRAANTLDSMVGYRNDRYLRFGWASARLDDVLNWIPARLTGLLLVIVSALYRPSSPSRSFKAIVAFARLHPSPNSGIPESAVAGALGIQLGGTNRYGEVVSERAKMGWATRSLRRQDIVHAVRLLYGVGILVAGGLLCAVCGYSL